MQSMRIYRLLAGLLLATSSLLAAPRVTHAHASPTRAEPGIEQVAPAAPPQLRVWFSEELATQGNSLEVWDSAGARVDRADARVDLNDPDRKLLIVSLNPLQDGVYNVNWKSMSRDDGHEASGTFRFGVGASTVLPPREGSATPRIKIDSATLSGNALNVRVGAEQVTIRQPPATDMGHADGGGHGADHGAMGHGGATGPAYGHLHVYLNGVDVLHAYNTEFSLADLPSGNHQLRLELVNEQHGSWNPTVETTLTVLVP